MRDTNLANALREHAADRIEAQVKVKMERDIIGAMRTAFEQSADRIVAAEESALVLKKEIEKLRGQLPRWIPVEERLPDAPGHYLICTNINYWHGGCLDKNEERKYFNHCGTTMGYEGTTKSVLDCYYDVTGSWNRVWDSHVTHWMPLPEPPEEERRTKQ